MFSEDVVLGALKAGPSWFISDHLLRTVEVNGERFSARTEDVKLVRVATA
jgi:hypothetical protein